MRWKAFRDMLVGDGARGKILHGVKSQGEQAGEEKHRKGQEGINQLLFGQQVHQKAGDKKGIHAGHGEDERNLNGPSIVGQIGDENHQGHRAKHADENKNAALEIAFEINRM